MVKNLDLTVDRGEVTGLLGPSGSGKTTLLRALVGVQVVESGVIEVLGQPAGTPELRHRVGYVTQAPSVYASVLTNLTDLAFAPDGSLYAVEIASTGLLNGPIGALVRITPGASQHTTVAGDLFAPYGVALTDVAAYVTTCAVCVGGGEVIKIPLD